MGVAAVVTATLLVLLLTPALAVPAGASTAAQVTSGSAQWAYGGQRWVNVSVTLPNGTFSENAFFGWDVIFTATNTSASTVALEAQRVVGAAVFVSYCSPSCSSPTRAGNVSVVAWERDVGYANLTTNAVVYENGVAASAVGILNASHQSASRLNESYSFTAPILHVSRSSSASLMVAGSSTGSSSFTPALGLVPDNLSSNLTWNASSLYHAQMAWSMSYNFTVHGMMGTNTSGSGSPSGNITGGGNVSLLGADLGNVTLRNGATVPVVALQVVGPFDDLDGVILIPHAYNVFGAAVHPYDAHAIGIAVASTARLDAFVDASHHLHTSAAATSYGGSSTMLTASSAESTSLAGAQPVAASAGNLVQAQPMTVPQAQQGQHCLSVGCAVPGGAAASGLLGLGLVVGLLVAAVVGSIAVIEWRVVATRRTQMSGTASVPYGAQQSPVAAAPASPSETLETRPRP